MQANNLPKLSVAEFEIMKVVWKEGEAAVSMILNGVNAQRDDALNRSTIRVQINRLVDKGWIRSKTRNGVNYYTATVLRREASSLITEDLKERVFNGSCLELVKSLFQSSEMSGSEIDEIRDLIDEKRNEENKK